MKHCSDNRCNLALGLLKEDATRIEGLVKYLNRFDVGSSNEEQHVSTQLQE